jgi:hypothetical protein
MSSKTVFVDALGDLCCSQCGATIRPATRDERIESREEETGTGHIETYVEEAEWERAHLRFNPDCVVYRPERCYQDILDKEEEEEEGQDNE